MRYVKNTLLREVEKTVSKVRSRSLVFPVQSLTVDDGQRYAELRRVVRRHDDDVTVRHMERELVKRQDDVGYDEADRPHAATQLRPRPQVVEELDARHRTPHHREDQGAVHGAEVHHRALHPRQHVHVENHGQRGADRPSVRVERLQSEC